MELPRLVIRKYKSTIRKVKMLCSECRASVRYEIRRTLRILFFVVNSAVSLLVLYALISR
jgi:hypothetical protein